MRNDPRHLVYQFGRLTILSLALAFPATALAQADADAPAPAPAPPEPAPAAAPPPPPPEWQQRIDEIDQRSRITERKLELSEEAAIAKKKETPVVSADDGGFSFGSADKKYVLRLRGLVQADGRRFVDDVAFEDRDAFNIRRVRAIFAGTLYGLADFLISPDFGNNTTIVTDAYVDFHPRPWIRLRAGKFKPPLGLERLQADQDLVFIERALDSNLTAQREIGLQLWGDVLSGLIRYELGVYNGVPDGTLLDVDSNHAKTFGGRLFIHPFAGDSLKHLGRLGVGIAASTGNEKGTSAAGGNTWVPSFRSTGQNTIYSYLTNATDPAGTVFALARHSRVNPQLYYYLGPFGLLAEWVKEYQELSKGSDAGAVNHSAGHVIASFVIGGDETYEGPKPRKPVDIEAGAFGAIEIGVRYGWLNLDDVSFPTLASATRSVTKAQAFGLALNWVLTRNLKAMGTFERTTFTGGASSGDRANENVLLGRLQAAF